MNRVPRALLLLAVLSALAVGAFLALGRDGAHANPDPTITVNGYDDFPARDSQMTLREAVMLATGLLSVTALSQAECIRVSPASWDSTLGCSSSDPPGASSADTIVFDAAIFPPGSPGTITLTNIYVHLRTGGDSVDGSGAGVIVDGGNLTFTCFLIGSGNNSIKGLEIHHCSYGIAIYSGSGNTIGGSTAGERNVISGNTYGVGIQSATLNSVKGNYIGTDAGGTSAIPNTIAGVFIHTGAQNNTIGGGSAAERNVISGNAYGVVISDAGTDGNTVDGNYIGTNAAGTAAVPNLQYGVHIKDGAQNNTIGGSSTAERNVISGNGSGVRIQNANGNTVKGNYIGINAAGTAALPNEVGVYMEDAASNNSIGGSTAGERNVISGNIPFGVFIEDGGTNGNTVKGNYIGTDAAGTAAIPNETGVFIWNGARNNTIGGTAAGAGNTIAFNTLDGVHVEGAGAIGNTIRGNSIHSNGARGIDNFNGGNAELAPPVITGFGSVIGTACPNCTVDVYSDNEDEGRVYEGSTTADNGGDWTYDGSPEGPFVTATATDAAGNTSEFSTPVEVPEATPTPTPTPTATPGATPTPAGPTRTLQWSPGWNNATWSGASTPEEVFACAAGKYAAAYRYVAGGLERYFPGRPDISNMQPLAQYDAFLILITEPVTCTMPVAAPSGSSRTLQWGPGWNNAGWSGPDATLPQQAFACADGSYAAAYRYVASGLERYFPGRPDISNMGPLNKYDAFLILVTAPVTCTMAIAP